MSVGTKNQFWHFNEIFPLFQGQVGERGVHLRRRLRKVVTERLAGSERRCQGNSADPEDRW